MSPSSNRPLLLPLKKRYWQQFASGEKKYEIRPYGLRWNERVCRPGREVLVSCGYGKGARLPGVIERTEQKRISTLPDHERRSIRHLYGDELQIVLLIHISLADGQAVVQDDANHTEKPNDGHA